VVFADQNDANAKLIAYWIGRPMPQGKTSSAARRQHVHTTEPGHGACNSQ